MKTLRPVAKEARMSRPDEGMIHQWLDGECTPEESAEIERLIATDAAWAAAVAEARGLIAASSRIVGALDAVPRAMPAGSRAAPVVTPSVRPTRVPSWMKVAAAVVVVAGTAYALRDRATEPFRPAVTAVDGAVAPQPTMAAPMEVPTIGPANTADRTVSPASPVPAAPAAVPLATPIAQAEATGAAGAGVSEKSTAQPTTPPAPPPRALDIARADEVAASRRARVAADAPRGAIARAQEMAPAAAPAFAPTLEGCWRVSAPPELLGVLNAPVIRRESGDTLVIVTARGDVTVVRAGDELRGGLQAKRESCGALP
jgi:hypothetical protein